LRGHAVSVRRDWLTFPNQSSTVVNVNLGLLRHRDFRHLFAADSISQVGSQVTLIALPLVAVVALHASAFEVGLLAASGTAAFLLIGLPAGAWVDRMRRRNVLIVGDVGRAVLLASVPVAWWFDVLGMAQLYVVSLLVGVLTVFFEVAYQSYLPHLVGPEHLVEGNSKLQVVQSVAILGGPTLGGLLVQVITAPVAIAVDAVSFLGSALFVGAIGKREARPPRAPNAHLGREIAEGLRFVFGNRLLRAIVACTGTSNLFHTTMDALLILYFARELGLSPGVIGIFYSAYGVGGILGSFVVTPAARLLGQGPSLWLAILTTGLAGLFVPLAEPGWRFWVAAAMGVIHGVGVIVYNVNQLSFHQRLTPDRLLGRMNATVRFVVWGTIPLGGVLGGTLAAWLGVHTALWVGAIGQLLAVLPVLLSPLRSMRALPSPESGHAEPVQDPV
jgi:MFS family permease